MNYPKSRKSPVKLTDEERYTIYKFCIENRCIDQIEDAVAFRVNKKLIAKEMNALPHFVDRNLSDFHITDAVETVLDWQRLLNKQITVQESVEIEQLKISVKKHVIENENLKIENEKLFEAQKGFVKEIERLKKSDAPEKLARIRAIVSA